MTTKVELITPEIATDILENHNPSNRTVSESTVAAYATDMRNKRWRLTHQGLAFDDQNNLKDGQHRLWAVIMSGCSIEFNVTRGLAPESMDSIDNGRNRSVGSQMSLNHGIKNSNCTAGVCRQIAAIIINPSGIANGRFPVTYAMVVHGQYGPDIEAVFNALDTPKRRAYLLAPLAMYHKGEPEKALEFCRQMATLEGMSAPSRVLIKFLESKHTSSNPSATVRMTAKCILAFHNGVATCERFNNDNTGLKFLLAMFPSMNKRIADQLKAPMAAKVPRKLTSRVKK